MTSTARWAVLLFSFLGIADATYLAQHAMSGVLPSCSIGGVDGCRIVAQSIYTHIFGVPLGVYGAVFYGLVFVLAAVSLIVARAHITRALRALSVIGAFVSVVFILIQVFLIKAMCLYCEGSAILSILILVAVWWPARTIGKKRWHNKLSKKLAPHHVVGDEVISTGNVH